MRKLEYIAKPITFEDFREQRSEGLKGLDEYYSNKAQSRAKKSTLNTYYGNRVGTKEGLKSVVDEIEKDYNNLKEMVEANNNNVAYSVLISLGAKKELLEDAKRELENFNK